jgi:5-methylcytosine-specific restriction protein A
MPMRPPHPCSKHAWVLVYDGGGCLECAKHPSLSRTLDARPGASQRGYGREHQRKRDALIARVKYCQDPYGLHIDSKVNGTVRDHIVPLNKGGSDDESNEQLLCIRCHNIKIYRDGSRNRGGRSKSL